MINCFPLWDFIIYTYVHYYICIYVHMHPFVHISITTYVHMEIYTLLHSYICSYIHNDKCPYVYMYIRALHHSFICRLRYSFICFPVLLSPYPPIPPLNRLSEPCRAYVDLLPYPRLYAIDAGENGNLLYPLPVGFIHSLYANSLAWFLLGFNVISLKLGRASLNPGIISASPHLTI